MQQETIARIRDGDLDAYEAVVRQYQGMLLGYAANRLPGIDAAQEVVQLTFIRAYEELAEYQPERDFGVWLCVICKHFILTELERQRRELRNLEMQAMLCVFVSAKPWPTLMTAVSLSCCRPCVSV